MKLFIKVAAILLCLALTFSLCGCSEDGESAIIYYGITDVPNTVDPQTASSGVELMLVRNLYEGLLRQDTNGNIVNGVIDSYTYENNTYTFKISEDAKWSDGYSLTANDFVYALRRAVNPQTNSPNVDCLFSIKGAEDISKGLANPSALGVTAKDSKTLVIELIRQDDNFLYTLTMAICMPCRQSFFEGCVGKYGMSYDTTLTNGSYKLRKWATENFAMRITKNDKYTGDFIAKNGAVYFTKNNDLTTLECLDKSYIDIAQISYDDLKSANGKYSIKEIENIVWVLRFGPDFTADMKKALINSSLSKGDSQTIGRNIKISSSAFPSILDVNSEELSFYNLETAKYLYSEQLKLLTNKTFPKTSIEFYGDASAQNIAKKIAGNWQTNLGAYINISALPYLSSPEGYDLQVFSIEVSERNVYDYLKQLGYTYQHTTSLNEVQNIIFGGVSNTVPVAFSNSYFAYVDCLTNVVFSKTNGYIDFSQIVKQN